MIRQRLKYTTNHQISKLMKGILFVFLLFIFGALQAQDGRPIQKDRLLWTELKVEKEISKDLEIELSHSLRWDADVSDLYRNFSQIGAQYDIVKWFSVKVGYRYAYSDQGYQRLFAVAGFDYSIENFKIDWNNRYEYTNERLDGEDNEHRLREKVSLKYKKKKWFVTPSIYGELFLPFGQGQNFPDIDRVRYGTSLDLDLTKDHTISIGASTQDTYKKKRINRDFIFMAEYKFAF